MKKKAASGSNKSNTNRSEQHNKKPIRKTDLGHLWPHLHLQQHKSIVVLSSSPPSPTSHRPLPLPRLPSFSLTPLSLTELAQPRFDEFRRQTSLVTSCTLLWKEHSDHLSSQSHPCLCRIWIFFNSKSPLSLIWGSGAPRILSCIILGFALRGQTITQPVVRELDLGGVYPAGGRRQDGETEWGGVREKEMGQSFKFENFRDYKIK